MKKIFLNALMIAGLITASFQSRAQQKLDVSVIKTEPFANLVRIVGVATAPGFAAPNDAWSTMNLTWRIPKTAAIPAPTVGAPPPAITPEVINESTGFTGALPRDAFNGGTDLTIFDLTTFGEPDDGFWYFQLVGSAESVQSIPTGASVVLYEFTLPETWRCTGCVEILTTEVPALIAHNISTASYIDNATLAFPNMDVLNIVENMAPLPVRFSSFEAERVGDRAELTWKTTDEQNVKGYYIERSADGTNYTRLGYVTASAPAASNSYLYVDEQPLTGKNYYRIREEDLDGRAVYSYTRLLLFNKAGTFAAFIYPVPALDKLKINIQAQVNEKATLRISDMQGRTITLQNIQLKRDGNLETIEVNHLRAGMYMIELTGPSVKWSDKFIKK
jgi:hypothetical protein